MNENQLTKERTCAIYASDYHFEMITLPYIEENLEKNKKIIVLTENDLEDTVKVLISRLTLDDNKKKKLLEIDWNNNDLNKLQQITKEQEESDDTIILIKGKKSYIQKINEQINNLEYSNLKIIDCYDINEVSGDFQSIINSYDNLLNTSGEKKIEK